MAGWFVQRRWAVVDCYNGEFYPVERLPFEIGAGEEVDLRYPEEMVSGAQCGLREVKNRVCLERTRTGEEGGEGPVLLDGGTFEAEELAYDRDYAVQVGRQLLLIRGGRNLEKWRKGLSVERWYLEDPDSEEQSGPWSLEACCQHALEHHWPPHARLLMAGSDAGFSLRQVLEVVEIVSEEETAPDADQEEAEVAGGGDAGEHVCPVCWLRFDAGEVMHVAVHEELRGDPILGEDAPQRFWATRFNDRGQALDAYGLPSVEMACPHCRRLLPPGFLELPHYILSIVGDQSAGKSYYLSVLAKVLPVVLYRQFGVVFQDADPAENALLNEMKRTLFGARRPEEAKLAKTQLEGGMYERLPRLGRMVALPKPFVFSLSRSEPAELQCGVIFYDNAGEHFQPGRDSAESPGAQHVASSSGLLFLFDPFNASGFRERMVAGTDPQLERPLIDQQDVLLSELRVRLKKLCHLGVAEKVAKPMAVVVGKCDAWMNWIGEDPFRDPLAGAEGMDLEVLRENSRLTRELLLELAPTVVANAEAISEDVLYFPQSSFGHAPVKLAEGDYVPDPGRLKPLLVEAPVLWLLSRVVPGLVKVSNS